MHIGGHGGYREVTWETLGGDNGILGDIRSR